jgi:hypothetical protein
MIDRGKLAIITMLALGVAAAGFAVWFRYQQGRRTLELWGAEHAAVLRNADRALVRRVRVTGNDSQQVTDPNGKAVMVGPARDLADIRDFAHIRRAFLDDVHFLWDQSPRNCEPHWAYMLEFQQGENVATIWIDDACDVVQLAERPEAFACMNPPLLRSVRRFLEKQAPQ